MAATAVPETSHSAARSSPQRVTLGVFTPTDGGVRCSQRGAVSRQTPALSVRRISSTEQPVCRGDTCPLHTRTQKNTAVRISFVISSELTLGHKDSGRVKFYRRLFVYVVLFKHTYFVTCTRDCHTNSFPLHLLRGPCNSCLLFRHVKI